MATSVDIISSVESGYNSNLIKYQQNLNRSKSLMIESNTRMKKLVSDTIREQEAMLEKELELYTKSMLKMCDIVMESRITTINYEYVLGEMEKIKTKIIDEKLETKMVYLQPQIEKSMEKAVKKISDTTGFIEKKIWNLHSKKRTRNQ